MAKAIQLERCLAVIFSVWSSAKSSFYEDLCLQHVFVNQPKAHPIYAEEAHLWVWCWVLDRLGSL